jgi:fido (protein-threonine AMPylation protein)
MAHQPYQRNSLEGLFENPNTSRSQLTSPEKFRALLNIIKNSVINAGFPNWRTLRGLSKNNVEDCFFGLNASENYRSYAAEQEDVNILFRRSSAIIQEIREMLGSEDRETLVDFYIDFMADKMVHMIFGSNMQEKAGMGLEETIKLCRQIFEGKEIDAGNVDQRSPEYEAQLKLLVQHGVENPDLKHVVQSRREVIQHTQALMHITDAALNSDEPLTEKLICDTHRILCQGIPLGGGSDNDGNYAGVYRNTMAMAGSTLFTAPENVPAAMQRLIADFNGDIRDREINKNLDPFYLAADICQDFVTIHPFKDGNGRMCRLIANAFLIKYAGIVISIGEHDEERKQYLAIAEMAGDGETEEEARGTLAGFFLGRAEGTLRKLKEILTSSRH